MSLPLTQRLYPTLWKEVDEVPSLSEEKILCRLSVVSVPMRGGRR